MSALMLQGTGSDVGKSVLVAGLCRALANRGLAVRPFKPQNMSNNAAVTVDGGEIGRAQALQALACRVVPHSDMNPVLLKPQADRTSQLVVHGRVRGTLGAADFREARRPLLADVLESYERLRAACDIVLVEGAGSPAEINLRAGDIANMGFARAANVPVILVGDIDRGGVIASVVGTKTVIDRDDAAMIAGFLINKFRGDPALFDDGYREIERRSGWRGFGVIPWLDAAKYLPSEDAVVLDRRPVAAKGAIVVACPILPRIANFDDLDPLKLEPGVRLVMVPPASRSPQRPRWSFFPDRKRRSPILPPCGPRDGTSTSRRMSAAAGMFWDCAAATRCSADAWPIPTASRARARLRPVWDCSISKRDSRRRRFSARSSAPRLARRCAAMRCIWAKRRAREPNGPLQRSTAAAKAR